MKINKTLGALALGLGVATAAQAQVTSGYTAVYISGSTAFRAQIFQALGNELGLTVASGGTSGKNSFTFQGTISDPKTLGLTTGAKVEVFCNFSGSAEGVGAMISNTASLYLEDDGATTFNHNGLDFAFSDVGQNSTPATTTQTGVTLPEIQTAADAGYEPYTGMAVQPFSFAVNKAAATAGVANISQFNFQDLYRVGTEDIALMTTNSGTLIGSGVFVHAVGRYNLSGTRITSILDDSSTTVDPLVQFALSPDGTSTPGLNNGDSSTPTGSQWVNVGNGGYFTGGNVGSALANGASAPPAIGYIGWSDAQSKFGTTGAVPINWLGQYPGTLGNWNIHGVENGSYTFFTYERLYENPSDQSTAYDSYGNDLVVGVQYEITHAVPQTADVEGNMNVYRATDGGDVVSY